MTEIIPQTLLADGAVTALVGNRIKPVGTNQGDTFPYVTFQTVSDVPERCREGIAVETIRVQVSAFATSYGQAQALYKAIRNALDGAQNAQVSCEWMNAQDLPHEPGLAYGKAIDFQLITR
jgi:predicted GNAT superfamily acetyltransferase